MTKRVLMTTLTLAIITVLALPRATLAQEAAAAPWKRDITLGYNQSNGNTDNAQLNFAGSITRTFENASELSSALEIYYAETDNKMDTQKWTSLTRYAYEFGSERRWFNSFQLGVSHDYFADIDYRILPAVGVGYWFEKTDDFKLMSEGSLGYEFTEYRSDIDSDGEPVIILHGFVEKRVLDNARVSEDLSLIPSLDSGDYRVTSESKFTNPIAENLDLQVKYIVDYDSNPAADKKKTDTRFITAIHYAF